MDYYYSYSFKLTTRKYYINYTYLKIIKSISYGNSQSNLQC